MKNYNISMIVVVLTLFWSLNSSAQQDPQYSQYMYNTMVVNPGYTGQREVLSVSALYRNQWVGIDGAPETINLGIHTPLRNDRFGLGMTIVKDGLGPADEIYVDSNFSYTILLSYIDNIKLSFGVKAGVHQLKTDWSKGIHQTLGDETFSRNLNLFSPTVGTGFYMHSENWYLGLSVPNLINTKHYDDFSESLAKEKMHYYLIGGYVFDIDRYTKFKPTFLLKSVSGAPMVTDLSANFLFNEKFTLGLGWRNKDSFSGLAGFQISDELFLGYSYDFSTTQLQKYNSGTHEIMLRFELSKKTPRFLTPRFF